MTLYISESEMLSRYCDGLQQAASKAKEILSAEEKDKPGLLVDFLHGIKVAAGSSHQLAHSQVDHANAWLDLRDTLEKIIDIGQALPLVKNANGHWFSIMKSLNGLVETGKKLHTSKAFSRADVLFDMNLRAKNAPEYYGQ